MLDEPSLSRQWVARRLQRALSIERWCGPVRLGMARRGGADGSLMAQHAASAGARAQRLAALIRHLGSEPYGSWGIGARLARAAGGGLSGISRALARRTARHVAELTLSEYRTLRAFVQDAPGVSSDLFGAVDPLCRQAEDEMKEIDRLGQTG